jgi:hypothetical protein
VTQFEIFVADGLILGFIFIGLIGAVRICFPARVRRGAARSKHQTRWMPARPATDRR